MASTVLNASLEFVLSHTSSDSTNTGKVIITNSLISDDIINHFLTIQVAIVCAALCLFGLTTNVVNIIVFTKMKFKDTINIALLGLAVSDSCALLTLLWFALCANPLFRYSSYVRILTMEIQYKTGTWTHYIFTRVTAFITAYITLERCLCIAFPMQIKRILTPNRVVGIILIIYIVIFGTLSSNYFNVYYGWKFVPELNRTMIGMIFKSNRVTIQTIAYSLNAIYVIIPFTGVLVCSAILIWKLKQRSKWLNDTATSGQTAAKSSAKDQQVITMVVCVAVIFISTFTPSVLLFLAMTLDPELNLNKSRENLFLLLSIVQYTLNAINSSVNFFVYYKMSSKFAQTFRSLFIKPKGSS